MPEISFAAQILKSPDKGVARLWLDDDYEELVRSFAMAHKLKPGTKVRIIMAVWENDCSIRAFNLFHALRDRLAKAQEDISGEYKEHLKQSLKYDFGVRKELFAGTYWLKSTTHYTVKEMVELIDRTIDRCMEEKAVIADLLKEFQALKKEQEAYAKNRRSKTGVSSRSDRPAKDGDPLS